MKPTPTKKVTARVAASVLLCAWGWGLALETLLAPQQIVSSGTERTARKEGSEQPSAAPLPLNPKQIQALSAKAKKVRETLARQEGQSEGDRRKATLEKYDVDHNGTLDDEELRQSMLESKRNTTSASTPPDSTRQRRRVVLPTSGKTFFTEPNSEGTRRRVVLPTEAPPISPDPSSSVK